MKRSSFDVSKLTNLQSLCLRAAHIDNEQVDVFLYVLSMLKSPGLRRITLAIRHDNRFMEVKELDDFLALQFKNLEIVVVQCIGLSGEELAEATTEIQSMFSQVHRRGLLRIQSYVSPFYY